MITHREPMLIEPPSDVNTAPCRTRVCGPISTSPDTVADGATQAKSWICGDRPKCSTSMAMKLSEFDGGRRYAIGGSVRTAWLR